MKTAKPRKPPARTSDAAVQARTGKTWPEWFRILDRAGARNMTHQEIVAHLRDEHGIGSWWQQMVTVAYEQERGLREKHQTPEGYQISRSVTLRRPVDDLFQAWQDKKARGRWLKDNDVTIRKATANKLLRITWVDDKTHVEVYFAPKGASKTQVVVQHRKLPTAQAAERMKAYWGKALERFKETQEA